MALTSAGVDSPSSPSRNLISSGYAAVASIALVRVALYLAAASHYGYFRDELYYLACGEHPAWGYMDQPPMIAWMAWLLQHTIGTSLYAIRLLPMLADLAAIIITALLTQKLGGRSWARRQSGFNNRSSRMSRRANCHKSMPTCLDGKSV
jgi:hypothetical protein